MRFIRIEKEGVNRVIQPLIKGDGLMEKGCPEASRSLAKALSTNNTGNAKLSSCALRYAPKKIAGSNLMSRSNSTRPPSSAQAIC